jgi:hypothetical protein
VFALARGQIIVELEIKSTQAGVTAARYLRDEGLYEDAFLLCDPEECAAVRAAVEDVPIMTRPHSAEEVVSAIAFSPPPILVHVDANDAFLTQPVVDMIHGAGARVFANGFVAADSFALLADDLSGYAPLFDRGVDVLQTEYPQWALMAMGRWPRD